MDPHTETPQPQYRFNSQQQNIYAEFKQSDKLLMTPEKVLCILQAISDEDVALLGLDPIFARPDWMIIQVLPVPPPYVRPSVAFNSTNRSEDDLTNKLMQIVRSIIFVVTFVVCTIS